VNRVVLPELLDFLPPQDAAALRSRRDLRRINAWMRHPQIMARVLQQNLPDSSAQNVVELGAGDGHFLLSVVQRLNGSSPDSQAILVDRLKTVDSPMIEAFRRSGWRVRSEIAEAADWLRQTGSPSDRTILSNLFFHQFGPEQLAEMLSLAAGSSRLVIALEPRRAWLPRLCGRLLWAIGCSPVTRHDAPTSIRAGFSGQELSALWPEPRNWRLTERPVGLFSHLFIARRQD